MQPAVITDLGNHDYLPSSPPSFSFYQTFKKIVIKKSVWLVRGRCDHQVPLWLHGEYEETVRQEKPNRAAITHSISGFSYRLYVDGTAASPHPSVRRMLENREYCSPWSTFVCQQRFCTGRQCWRWKVEKLLLEKAAASLTISSVCHTWEKLVLPPAHILMNTLWCYSALKKDTVVALSARVAPSVLAVEFKPEVSTT